MSSLNTRDEQAPKVEKENGYSIVANKLLEDNNDNAEQATDEESNEELFAVQDFSNVKDLQSAILSYLFAFPVAPYLPEGPTGLGKLDDQQMVVNFSNINDQKIYEPPEDRKKLVAFLSAITNSVVTTKAADSLPDLMRMAQNFSISRMPQSSVDKKINSFFASLKKKLNLASVRTFAVENNNIGKGWTSGQQVTELNNQIYTKILPVIKEAFKHDTHFSKMLELAEERYRKVDITADLNAELDRVKTMKRIVDIASSINAVEKRVDDNGFVTSLFLKSSKFQDSVPYQFKFKDGLVLTINDISPESHSNCYRFKKKTKDKQTGRILDKEYVYSPITKTLIEYDINTGKCVYKNYSNSKIESYNDGYIHKVNGTSYLYCNGGKKIVCIDSNDKRFGYEFTAVTDEKQKQLVKDEPGMTFGYWTTFDASSESVYKTFGQKKKNDFSYNPAHDAKLGNEFAVSIKNDQISSIEEENKSNFIKSKRCINGLNLQRPGKDIPDIYKLLNIKQQDREKYAQFVDATCEFIIHKREREKMYSKNYDYEEKMIDKAKKEQEKKEKKEAKEKAKKEKKEAKEKEKKFKKIANEIYKEKLKQELAEEEPAQVDAYTEQEINDVKNIIARLKQDALQFDSSRLMNTEETGFAKLLNFLLKIITFGTVDISKRHKEDAEMNKQELMDSFTNNVKLDIRERNSLLNKLGKYITLHGDMNGVIEDIEGLQQHLVNVSQGYVNFAKDGDQDIKNITIAFSNIATSGILSRSMEKHDKNIEAKKKHDEIKLNALEEARKKMSLEKQ